MTIFLEKFQTKHEIHSYLLSAYFWDTFCLKDLRLNCYTEYIMPDNGIKY